MPREEVRVGDVADGDEGRVDGELSRVARVIGRVQHQVREHAGGLLRARVWVRVRARVRATQYGSASGCG